MEKTDWPKWFGCRPTPLMEAAIQAEYRVNVGDLHDTSH